MIDYSIKFMSEDEKGKKFLELIDEQNNLQWTIIEKLNFLINQKWDSSEIKKELENLMGRHSTITKDLNSLDADSNVL